MGIRQSGARSKGRAEPTPDKNIKFFNEYQRNECLWDPKHPLYKNREAREAAYKVIMETTEMGRYRERSCKQNSDTS